MRNDTKFIVCTAVVFISFCLGTAIEHWRLSSRLKPVINQSPYAAYTKEIQRQYGSNKNMVLTSEYKAWLIKNEDTPVNGYRYWRATDKIPFKDPMYR